LPTIFCRSHSNG